MTTYDFNADSGKTLAVTVGGKIGTGFISKHRDNNPDCVNIKIKFAEAGYGGYTSALFKMKGKSDKTCDTYITRINKIIDGVNPDTRQAYTGAGGGRAKHVIGIVQHDLSTVRIFKIDGSDNASVQVNVKNKTVSMNSPDFELLAPYVLAMLDPYGSKSRINKMAEFEYVDSQLCEVAPPTWKLEYMGKSVEYNSMPDEAAIVRGKSTIASQLVADGIFDLSGLQQLNPIESGGGKAWLWDFIRGHFNPPPAKPLPLPAESEAIHAQSA